jgi:hypothetical protein
MLGFVKVLPQKGPALARVAILTSATLAAHGVTPTLQGELFSKGAPVLDGLCATATTGLGARSTVVERMKLSVQLIEQELLQPTLRQAVSEALPVCAIMDESMSRTLGSTAVVIVYVFHALMREPLALEVLSLEGNANAQVVQNALRDAFVREGYMTLEEYNAHVVLLASDHAAYMLSAAKAMGIAATGDGPHAVELMVKAIAVVLELRPFISLCRKVFWRPKSIQHTRLYEVRTLYAHTHTRALLAHPLPRTTAFSLC